MRPNCPTFRCGVEECHISGVAVEEGGCEECEERFWTDAIGNRQGPQVSRDPGYVGTLTIDDDMIGRSNCKINFLIYLFKVVKYFYHFSASFFKEIQYLNFSDSFNQIWISPLVLLKEKLDNLLDSIFDMDSAFLFCE